MEIYDIIHGSIEIDPLAKRIIDTDEFQRLRYIKQLGCCNFVFPGTVHTRFEHSIGVYHLAKKYIHILNCQGKYFNKRDIDCITIAALIHDIGHGPYSHLFDEFFDKDKNHEYRSGELFKMMNKKYDFGFNDKELQDIIHYIYPKDISIEEGKKFMYQIVSNNNGIDVDRFDYLLRDIKMTGLNYGIESERIMQNSKISNGEIIYSEKVRTNIEEFFHVRSIMYKEVYNHRTVRSIEFMMKDFIREFNNLYNIKGIIENDNWSDFIQLNDSITHLQTLKKDLNKNEINMRDIIHSITSRNIYKCVGELLIHKIYKPYLTYDKINIVVDSINISNSNEENCKYYKEEKYFSKETDLINNNRYILRIYIKDEKYRTEATKLFQILKYQFSGSSPSS
tara:strand:- start:12 stop:1193 length:1182 start_codon:yes stop_codon:yes gene_type:complete